jgi:hypothetical protein
VAGDDVRASDGDRARVADLLTGQAGTGRLTPAELEDRVGRTYAAVTLADLRQLLSDLPVDPRLPVDPNSPTTLGGREQHSWAATLGSALSSRAALAVLALLGLAGLIAASFLTGRHVAPFGLIWVLFWVGGPAWRHRRRQH